MRMNETNVLQLQAAIDGIIPSISIEWRGSVQRMNKMNKLQLQAAIDGIIPPIKWRVGREHENERDE